MIGSMLGRGSLRSLCCCDISEYNCRTSGNSDVDGGMEHTVNFELGIPITNGDARVSVRYG